MHLRRFKTSAAGGIFLRASHGVRREVPPSSTRGWQKPTGAPFEILPEHNTHVYQPTQSKIKDGHERYLLVPTKKSAKLWKRVQIYSTLPHS